jgi:hypothetical protein
MRWKGGAGKDARKIIEISPENGDTWLMTKRSLLITFVLLSVCLSMAVEPAAARTMHDLPGLPTVVLKHELTKDAYAQLSRAPVKAYLVVRD